jgi:putative SOS response-associated peptidase YedK
MLPMAAAGTASDSIACMSTQFESLSSADLYSEAFNVDMPSEAVGKDVWPRKPGVFIRLNRVDAIEPPVDAPVDKAERLAEVGQFGLVPTWVKSASDAKLRSTKLVNARAEVVTTSNNFRGAWLAAKRCIVPMMSFLEDDFRSGKAVPTRIASRTSGAADATSSALR